MTLPTLPEDLSPADEPLVIRAMRRHKLELLRREQLQITEMVRRWRQVEDRLEAEMLALGSQISEMVEAGQGVNQARVIRLARYQTLLAQVDEEVGRYLERAADEIGGQQLRLGQLGIAHASEATSLSYVQAGRAAVRFNVLPVEAVENMVGAVADGTPLGDYLRRKAKPEALDGITRKLIESTALGRNPRRTARAMMDGMAGGLGSAMNTARTEQLRVYREASREQYRRSGVVTGYRRLSARDTRVCPACLFADGRRYDLGESLDEHNQGRCLVPGTAVSGPLAHGLVSRRYDGEVVVIRTASGKELTVTPNHPVLTRRGWVAAELLEEGDDVVSGADLDHYPVGLGPDEYQVPTRVEDVAGALGMMLLSRVPGSAEDFHGDGMDGEINVVWADRLLQRRAQATSGQHPGQIPLIIRNVSEVPLSRFGDIHPVVERMGPAAVGTLGNADPAQMLPPGRSARPEPIGFGDRANAHSGMPEPCSNCGARDAEFLSKGILGQPGLVEIRDFIGRRSIISDPGSRHLFGGKASAFGLAPKEPSAFELLAQASFRGSEASRGVLTALSGNVGFDRVLKVFGRAFSGHVYNLQTEPGWYFASGIVTHNCTLVPNVRDVPQTTWQFGQDWFVGQDAGVQRQILGPGRHDAWQDGAFELEDVVSRREDATWGNALVPAPLKDLAPGAREAQPA